MPDPEQKSDRGASKKGDRGLILLVEDDAFLRRLLKSRLEKEGFEVRESENGKDALEFLRDSTPLVVLLDLLLPVIDGFKVLEEIRKNPQTKTLPVIVLSNLSEEEHTRRAKKLGTDDYLVKAHFILDEIVQRVIKLIEKRYF